MKKILFLLMISVLSAVLWTWQLEGNFQNIALERAKNAVNRAAHDASMQIIKSQVGQGLVTFDQFQANQVFKYTLIQNMQLESDLTAKPQTLWGGQVDIVYTDFVDDSNVITNPNIDSAHRFPFDGGGKLYSYHPSTGEFNLQKMIYGPAVVYVIKVRKPIQIDSTSDTFYYIGSIFEYPFY